MADMKLEKYKMPEQDPNERNMNFLEVALGYTEELAMKEADRCLTKSRWPQRGQRSRLASFMAYYTTDRAGVEDGGRAKRR